MTASADVAKQRLIEISADVARQYIIANASVAQPEEHQPCKEPFLGRKLHQRRYQESWGSRVQIPPGAFRKVQDIRMVITPHNNPPPNGGLLANMGTNQFT